MGPRTGVVDMEKKKILSLPGLELRLFSRPACSQSLYRPGYPALNSLLLYRVLLTSIWLVGSLFF
jgi:hypothetical protein